MNTLHLLVSIVFDLFIMALILRLWLQWARADFYNPLSQTVVKVTQPIVAPLRRVIPAIGRIDTATLVIAYTVTLLKLIALVMINAQNLGQTGFQWDNALLLYALLGLIKAFGSTLFWILLIRAIMSWVSRGQNPMEYVLVQLTEPLLMPIRRILPAIGGLDLSVLVLFIILQVANSLMLDFFGIIWKLL